MNIFTIFFLQKAHQIAQFKKNFSREHTPEPTSIQVASPRSAWHKALCK